MGRLVLDKFGRGPGYPAEGKTLRALPEYPLMLKYAKWEAYSKSGQGVKPGDIVRVSHSDGTTEALVLNVFHHWQYGGNIIPKYRVAVRTKAGQWSKVWKYVFPGPVQRALREAYPNNQSERAQT